MGKESDAVLEFLRDDLRFADLFNGSLFAGEQMVNGIDLQESGEAYSQFADEESAPGQKKSSRKNRKRTNGSKTILRDIKKRMRSGTELRILALEEQGSIDYTMPCRCMEYDSAEYVRQKKNLQRKNRMNREYKTKDERLCDFHKSDRLTPIYTICLYLGERPWDGPRCLRDMMNFGTGEAADRWAEHFSDYEMKLICVNELENVELFTSELKELFALMHFRNNRQGLLTYLEEHEEYQNIDENTARAIGAVMGVETFMKNNDNFKNEQGGYDMCQAIREMWEEGIQIGKSEGIQIGKSEGITLSAAIFRAVNSGITDNEQIAHECNCSNKQVAEVRTLFGL